MTSNAETWDKRYRGRTDGVVAPATVVGEFLHLLPRRGVALDVACGLGGNALAFAAHGLDACAWDVSAVAIERLDSYARGHSLLVHTAVRDVVAEPPRPAEFDVIAVSRFLHRPLCEALSAALRPGGLLYYQTFTVAKAHRAGPANPAYLLADNELLSLFAGLTVRYYREEGCVGNIAHGFRNEAMLIGQRP